ncbi:HD-GYP domain-containing protein [Acidithrix sp. C25]|uniref:HD-GYP domain-containing protein n=1 Tax=Acidithrix sp. C25 TaxID=1671482 RepID=UPI00191BC707|nr:HD-GYP domain-containing protein [Acidithrix sp. C25]CAG4910478.1 unnamed protein product [Acidithrix sp. C25]
MPLRDTGLGKATAALIDQGTTTEPNKPAKPREWAAKPRHALLLHLGLFLIPIASAVMSSIVFSHIIREPHTTISQLAWLASLLLSSSLLLLVVERQTRRFLPLVALLKLTMIFPDQAPSRFKSAMRAGSVRKLEERVKAVDMKAQEFKTPTDAASVIELVASLTYHDRRTRGHAERVKAYALLIGQEVGLSKSDCNKLVWAALLHDVGKVAVSTKILNKGGALSPAEWEEIRRHPLEGQKLLEPLLGWMGPFANAVWEHHEKWNGQGYPLGLSGNNISLPGRIVSLADAYEVMTAARSYKRPMSILEARQEVVRCAGTHFDPDVVRAFLNISIGRLRFMSGPAAWIAQLPFLGWTAPVGLPAVVGTVGKTMALVSFVHGVAPSVLVTQAGPASKVAASALTANTTASATGSTMTPAPASRTSSQENSLPAQEYQGYELDRGSVVAPPDTSNGSAASASSSGTTHGRPTYSDLNPATTTTSGNAAVSHAASLPATTAGTRPGNAAVSHAASLPATTAGTRPGNAAVSHAASLPATTAGTRPGNAAVSHAASLPATTAGTTAGTIATTTTSGNAAVSHAASLPATTAGTIATTTTSGNAAVSHAASLPAGASPETVTPRHQS